eukprot:CAMPEP_0171162784 /NCGR_PEP_ID=MMETSP0790-20130122/4774_1 /TAXON_ID=2925 /ORGANISM="Alexandrium catenella, Strain OF101" /LENGTH=46 /DNA_ID= /DNA_START= /DNA_END= /DNA_ORIENTATION=
MCCSAKVALPCLNRAGMKKVRATLGQRAETMLYEMWLSSPSGKHTA